MLLYLASAAACTRVGRHYDFWSRMLRIFATREDAIMEVRVIRRDEQKPAAWSGGITTQLGIWPAASDYGRRDFGWRISSATVEKGDSVFTDLPGVARHIMCLEGEMDLVHDDGAPLHLAPFVAHSFDGGVKTGSTSEVRVIDFNLMTRGACRGKIQAVNEKIRNILLKPRSAQHFQCLYILCEDVRVAVGRPGERAMYEVALHCGDFMQIGYDNVPVSVRMSDASGVNAHGILLVTAGIACGDFLKKENGI